MLDIHSHILPAVDDGAKNINCSLALLKEMYSQGITDVIATPHFYAIYDSVQDFCVKVTNAYHELTEITKDMDLPNIYLGSEVLYFKGIGNCEDIKKLTLADSNYLLLEFGETDFSESVLEDIMRIKYSLDLNIIIAHIERYAKMKHFKNLLKLVERNEVLAQTNASSLFENGISRTALKLIKKDYIYCLGTDSHSMEHRPPMMKNALLFIQKKLNAQYSNKLTDHSSHLYDIIINGIDEETDYGIFDINNY